MTCAEAQELITGMVDGELLDPELASLRIHLEGCSPCRLSLEVERSLKQAVHNSAMRLRAPSKLRDKISTDQRLPSEQGPAVGGRGYLPSMSHFARPALIAAMFLAIVLPAFFFLRAGKEPVPVTALESYELFRKGTLSVHRVENPGQIVEQLTRAVGGHFRPMGYDLTAMHLQPVAGFVQEIQGRKILVAVYEGQGGILFCYTFFGSENEAPGSAARFYDAAKKMNFYAFSRGGLNAVLHREGEMICILASEMPMEELLALAKSKAKSS